MVKKRLVVLTGAGISAESGIQTFRDANGLWEGHDIMEVASYEGWKKDKQKVLEFYNQRRRQVLTVVPNKAHTILAELEKYFHVTIITQNVDNLHEKAGSKNVLHLHGELLKARSTKDENLVYDWAKDIRLGDVCENGAQLRPHIVWFGESVLMIESAALITEKADIFIIVGTSLQVYPAANLIQYTQKDIPKYYVDMNPYTHSLNNIKNLKVIVDKATNGLEELKKELITLS